jgi:hypothetical protein
MINILTAKIQREGEIGKQYARLKQEVGGSTAIKHRKLAAMVEGTNADAETIIEQAGDALNSLNAVLQGIVRGEKTSQYSTLSNIAQMGGKTHTEFMEDMESTAEKIKLARKTFNDIEYLSET